MKYVWFFAKRHKLKIKMHGLPIWWASLAFTFLPVSMRSRALERPINAGSLTVPPSINGTPTQQKLLALHE